MSSDSNLTLAVDGVTSSLSKRALADCALTLTEGVVTSSLSKETHSERNRPSTDGFRTSTEGFRPPSEKKATPSESSMTLSKSNPTTPVLGTTYAAESRTLALDHPAQSDESAVQAVVSRRGSSR